MNPLKSVGGTISSGVVLALLIVFFLPGEHVVVVPLKSVVIWFHVFAGIVWIGLLYYFNFVQVPALGEAASGEGGPGGAGIAKYVAPRALWWFRWGALATWLSGATVLHLQGILHPAFTLGLVGDPNRIATTIGVGAWLGTIMLFKSGYSSGRIRKRFSAWSKPLRKKSRRPKTLRSWRRARTHSCPFP